MGLADIVSRARAGSILRSPVAQDTITSSQFSEKPPLNEKQLAPADEGRNHRVSFNSNGSRDVDNTISRSRGPHHAVRTVPTWVHVLEEEEEESSHPTASLLPSSPPSAQVAQHHYHLSDRPQTRAKPPRGRLYDADRECAPPVPHGHPSEHTSRWRAYFNASAYPAIANEGGEIVTLEWLAQNGPDYSRPWMAGAGEEEVEIAGFKAKRKVWWKRLQRTIIRSPTIPLVLRTIVWIFSLIALALGASIHHYTDRVKDLNNLASTEMAIIVDAIALVYLLYITYDEYSGKPLGLRSARAKMRLIFLDLFFIVFDSANLSLAFEAVDDTATCMISEDVMRICKRQEALSSVLLIALIAWLLTFSISVLRLVERVTRK
ncbi:MAG: hypothetical protein Q9179_004352 [Wetmoreana sp. 5 TL-2023]